MKDLSSRIAAANSQLAPYAVGHGGVLGREFPDTIDATRFAFQRDRDRIIHSTSFRRLKGKTQVFVTGDGDHYRTRLTHTLEVAQVSRDIGRTLQLNEDLCECIGLAHDLGHPPFGHGGEQAIDVWMRTHGSTFEHNLQSHRIVTLLEHHSDSFQGLNLNKEILMGMLKHVTPHDHPSGDPLPEGAGHTLEAQVVNLSDEIAYTAHDSDDGLTQGLFTLHDISKTELGKEACDQSHDRGTSLRGSLIDLMVTDLYQESGHRIETSKVTSVQDVFKQHSPLIGFSKNFRAKMDELRAFLWKHMYLHPSVALRIADGQKIVEILCENFYKNPPQKVLDLKMRTDSELIDAVKDYVAGMTDEFATITAAEISASL